jgi:soluble P-type ATPase
MEYKIPGYSEKLEINTLLLDLNGTLTVDGVMPLGTLNQIGQLKEQGFRPVLISGNTRGDAEEIALDLDIDFRQATTAEDKAMVGKGYELRTAAVIGNGLIDEKLMLIARLGIVTLQAEGAHPKTLLAADIVVPTITDAFDLFLKPERMIATMRR